jgi:hypothetical protein
MSETEGVRRIAAERQRQMDEEGWSPEHDATHGPGVLTRAAQVYLMEADFHARHPEWANRDQESLRRDALRPDDHGFESPWPWSAEDFKPSCDPVRDLEKAGALIAAEIDRLLAAQLPDEGDGS